MLIRAHYENGSVFVNGNSYDFQDFKCNVPDHVGKFLLSRGEYEVSLTKECSLQDAKDILFIRGSGLGDIFMCVPIIRYVKKHINPKANIDWLCGSGEFASVLDGVPHIRKVYTDQNLPNDVSNLYQFSMPVDYAEFIPPNFRNLHRIDVFARRIRGLEDVVIPDKRLEYYVSEDEKEWFKKKFPNIKKFITMTTHTTCFNRVLTMDMNKKICTALIDMGYDVVMIDKSGIDSLHPKAFNMTGKLNLRQVGSVLYYADAVIVPDTGIFHMASALDKPILAYFGSMDPALRVTGSKTRVIYNKTSCFPCNGYTCHHGRPICIQDMDLNFIMQNFKALTAQNNLECV
jgi:ADP-heptose:LPS heptosyltransferase